MKATIGPLLRAQALVEARDAGVVAGVRVAEHRTVQTSNRWRHESGTVRGTAIGCRHTGGEWTDEPALVVLVSKKLPEAALSASERIPPKITVGGEDIRTDVLQIGRARLHGGLVGSQIVSGSHGGTNFGTIAGVLRDGSGNAYILSAAHVLCEAVLSSGKRSWLGAGTSVYLTATDRPDPIGRVHDRVIPDFSNSARSARSSTRPSA